MTDDFTFAEAFSGLHSLDKRVAFEREVSSTPIGRQSFELRQRARLLRDKGDTKEAFALCAQAASMFAKDDPSPAAAMSWFDLGRSHEHRGEGVRKDNLRNAERMYRRALASPALSKDPHRMGMVRDALASCLRYIAMQEDHPDLVEALLAHAVELFEEAVEIALTTGASGFEDVVRFSHNLANCHAQRGNHDAALFALDRAEAFARRGSKMLKPGAQEEYTSRILFHSAGYRELRGREGDREQAKKQLLEVVDIGHPEWVEMARMRLVWILLREAPPATEQAKVILRKIHVERIREEALPELAAHYVSSGMRKEALVLHHRMLQEAMTQWRDAMADHVADHHAADAQRAAHRAARLHLEEEDAFEAFFTLEDVSGLRFMENLELYTRIQKNPVMRVVGGLHHAWSVLAVQLENYASRLVQGHLDIRALLHAAKTVAPPDEQVRDEDRRIHGMLVEILEEASRHPDAMGFLVQKASGVAADVKRLNARMQELDPESFGNSDKPWLWRLTREVLRDLLREYPDHALVRLSLAEDLLVIAVWLEGDEVVARHHRVDVPEGLFKRIMQYRQDSKHPPLELLQKIAADLRSMDLSPALPPRRLAHAVLLPSYMASLLPLGALGPRGSTLLDHFDALSWMPSLAPLFLRQAPLSPRHGTVSIAPGGTRYHAFAFGVPLPDEARIEGHEATEERVLATARGADVVCLYTHGRHASERGPHVDLHGKEYLGERLLSQAWAGMERVELWACQSGVNMPTDPLVPAVDEGFGLDVEFVRHGVRSAIGTLWSVPDFVTACIVRTYRRGLRRGLSAPHALAEAQRFWRDEGARSLLDHVSSASSFDAGLKAFKATLGGDDDDETHDADLATFLGPAPAPSDDPQRRIVELVQKLAHPLSWAGFRFVGVNERRPTEPYNPDHFRPLTPEEMAEGERIVAEALREPSRESAGKPLDEWVEQWLAEATKLAPGGSPSPEQAIRVARLYRDRLVSSHRHNLLAALAWVHEAVATTPDDASHAEARRKLSIEAAWLWLDIARGDAIEPMQLVLSGPRPIAVARAERQLEGLPEDDHVRMLRAWIDVWKAREKHVNEGFTVFDRAWGVAKSILRAMRPETYEAMRTLTAAWEMPLFLPNLLPEAEELCTRSIDATLDMPIASAEVIGALARLRSAMALVVMNRRPDVMNTFDGMGSLTPRELAREALWFGMASDRSLSFEMPIQDKRFNHAWDAIEGGLWGWPDDDRTPLWASTGTLDGAYRRLVGSLLVGMARAPAGEQDAVQFIACLQPLCDLRLPLLRRWVGVMEPWSHRLPMYFWSSMREREMVLEYLEDAALMLDPEVAMASRSQAPHRLDPFRISAEEIEEKSADTGDLVPWQIAHACRWFTLQEGTVARTAAFRAILGVEERTRRIVSIWSRMNEVSEQAPPSERERSLAPSELFDPGLRLPNRRDMLRRAPPGAGVLGLAVEASGHLVAAAMWNGGDGLHERVHLTETKVGRGVQELLATIQAASLSEELSICDAAAARVAAFQELDALLGPVLERVLGPALDKGLRQLSVLAPGSLRALPILGLRVRGEPLYRYFGGIQHLPSLNVELHATDAARLEACWLPAQRERGDTSCGEAVIETLRRWFSPVVIRPPATPTRDIEEVGQLDPLGPALRTLRIYATSHIASLSPSTAMFNLEGGRAFGARHTRGLFLPDCQEVELWAATAGVGLDETIRRDDRDRLPGLVGDFLASGASAVLDIAWPVFDLVKALVCEGFGILRRLGDLDGAATLLAAIDGVARLFVSWRASASSFSDVRAALHFLDENRRRFALEVGLDADAIVPLADCLEAPSLKGLSVEALLEQACNPVHLAAFRYWSWLYPNP